MTFPCPHCGNPIAWQDGRPVAPVQGPPPPPAREVSGRTAQSVLFVLGGLLLGVAAVVFAAVAWAQFGVGGRALLLAASTGLALGVPVLALRRRLRATAETFAAVGLLLTLLDGYAAWHVNLFGVADGSGWGYAGAVFAVTAAVAAGYEHLTGLTGPRYAALVIAHPVLPLLVAAAHPGATGWALTFAVVAALDVALLAVRRNGGLALAAAVTGGLAVLVATACALTGMVVTIDPADAAAAGGALLLAALVVLAGALVSRRPAAREIAAALLVAAAAVVAARVAALLTSADTLLVVALVALAVAVVAPRAGLGARAGALAVVAAPGVVAAALAVEAGIRAVDTARTGATGWELPAAVAALGAALVLALPAAHRRAGALGAAAVLALTVPAGLGLPWWTTLILDALLVAAGVVLGRGRSSWLAYGPALAVGLLPHLAPVLDGDGQYLRRLLLGVACVAIVVAGVATRLRAPVLMGGGVLAVLALHELALVWDLVPRWIPLAVAGLVLVLLATTLERRRRDLHRFRNALHRMS
ncbi:SCO7613 C-terminal domain-containing membrane protein [Actinoplanes sp. URMC 104]|uniref:SCO7613 C-terminal domain-containing membrane protein n=1 Tax=Actinoplanes sp. URMC 104 TaxID=3423409 RepID=UPI003F1BAD1D